MKNILITLILAGYPIGGTTVQIGTTGSRPVAILGSGPVTVDVTSIVAGGCVDMPVTLTGATVGSPCIVGMANRTVGVHFTCRVSAANQLQLEACTSELTLARDPASQSYNFVVFNN